MDRHRQRVPFDQGAEHEGPADPYRSPLQIAASRVAMSQRTRSSQANRLNHAGKMIQKFSTFPDQSCDAYHIADRRDKSDHRA